MCVIKPIPMGSVFNFDYLITHMIETITLNLAPHFFTYRSCPTDLNSKRKSTCTDLTIISSTMPVPQVVFPTVRLGTPWRYRRSETVRNSTAKRSIWEEQESSLHPSRDFVDDNHLRVFFRMPAAFSLSIFSNSNDLLGGS
jgi:hypothetical protein